MIELFEQNIRTNDRQSSKGNQLKWENEGIWYKADYTGYEGLAEYMISHLLKKSTLTENEFVCYNLEKIKFGAVIYNGVKSKNFLSEDWQIITLERLFRNFFGESLYKSLYRIPEHKERLQFLVQQVERMTGLRNFGIYINKLLTTTRIVRFLIMVRDCCRIQLWIILCREMFMHLWIVFSQKQYVVNLMNNWIFLKHYIKRI